MLGIQNIRYHFEFQDRASGRHFYGHAICSCRSVPGRQGSRCGWFFFGLGLFGEVGAAGFPESIRPSAANTSVLDRCHGRGPASRWGNFGVLAVTVQPASSVAVPMTARVGSARLASPRPWNPQGRGHRLIRPCIAAGSPVALDGKPLVANDRIDGLKPDARAEKSVDGGQLDGRAGPIPRRRPGAAAAKRWISRGLLRPGCAPPATHGPGEPPDPTGRAGGWHHEPASFHGSGRISAPVDEQGPTGPFPGRVAGHEGNQQARPLRRRRNIPPPSNPARANAEPGSGTGKSPPSRTAAVGKLTFEDL